MTYEPTYYVWRRDDGYVDAIASSAGFGPKNGFDVLLETKDWDEARKCIEDNRDQRHYDLVESWNRRDK